MHEQNQDIRKIIVKSRFKYYEIADQMKIHNSTLSTWLRKALPPDKKQRILEAIEELKRGT